MLKSDLHLMHTRHHLILTIEPHSYLDLIGDVLYLSCVNFEKTTTKIEMKKKNKVTILTVKFDACSVVSTSNHHLYKSSHNRIEEKKVNVLKFKYQIVLFHFVELVEYV